MVWHQESNLKSDEYDLKTQPREGEGVRKSLLRLPPCSQGPAGAAKLLRQLIRKSVPASGEETPPWYVEADLNSYIESNKRKFYEAVELANRQCFIDYDEREKTTYASEFAAPLGISQRTLYRYGGEYHGSPGMGETAGAEGRAQQGLF